MVAIGPMRRPVHGCTELSTAGILRSQNENLSVEPIIITIADIGAQAVLIHTGRPMDKNGTVQGPKQTKCRQGLSTSVTTCLPKQ